MGMGKIGAGSDTFAFTDFLAKTRLLYIIMLR